MTTTDDRVRRALRQIAQDASAQADPEKAMAAVARRPRHLTTALWLGMAAAVAAGIVAYAVWPDDKDHVVAGGSSTTAANVPALTTASSVVPSTSVIPTTSVVPTTLAPPTTAVASTSGPTSTAGAADPLAPGVVEFTGIGQLRLDKALDELPGWASSFDVGPSCGNVTPNDTTWDVVQGRVAADEQGVLRVDAVYTYDSRFRTAEGMGVGSTLDELRAAYGDQLKEAVPELLPDGRPAISEPPYAHYGKIASVFDGDRAITFWLGGLDGVQPADVVHVVKVSHLDFAGDDEGCG